MAKVILRNVSKQYGRDATAVQDFNLEIQDKEFVVLVGPSGCGKSTTLRMVAGLESISSGELVIGDKVVNEVQPKHRDIAMVFQNYALYPHMTVYENMAFGLKLRKVPKGEIKDRVDNAASILGITELLDRKPKALSGGQRQRVALGRAIVREPKVFLFDEPLSNLDAKLRAQMRTEIAKLHSRLRTTMIYVTHDQIEAMTLGERIVVMKDGIIQQVDTPLNLYRRPENKFVAGFIGTPAMNLFPGTLVRDGGLKFEADELSLNLPEQLTHGLAGHAGKQVFFGIRPDDVKEVGAGPDSTSQCTIELTVQSVEPMGSETILHGTVGSVALVARVGADLNVQVGACCNLNLDLSKAHFFDGESEKSLFS